MGDRSACSARTKLARSGANRSPGSVILEVMFSWPGIGNLFFDSIMARDYPTVMALSVITAVLVLVGTLLADLSYAIVDPRVRYE